MKLVFASLTALAFIMTPVINARAAASCSLTIVKKKPDSKSATLNGVTLNAKTLEALSKSCSLTVTAPSISDLITAEQAASAKRIAKLKAKAN